MAPGEPNQKGELTTGKFVSPRELVRLTGMAIATIRRRLRDGHLPAIQPGGRRHRWLIDFQQFQHDIAGGALASPALQSPGPSGDAAAAAIEMLKLVNTAEAMPASSTSGSRRSGPRPRWMSTEHEEFPEVNCGDVWQQNEKRSR